MAFSYAVIRHDADGWHASLNDFSKTDEITTRTLPDLLQRMRKGIEEMQKEPVPHAAPAGGG